MIHPITKSTSGNHVATATKNIGNIPAYAGKTLHRSRLLLLGAEHPRVCGENGGTPGHPAPALGTSPRMRGKRCEGFGHGRNKRNIPAYAGKTW